MNVRAYPCSAMGVALLIASAIGCTIGGRKEPGKSELGKEHGGRVPFVASDAAARRLSKAELANTVVDLFGEGVRQSLRPLSEDELAPFDNDYTLQLTSQALIDTLDAVAEDVARRVIADPQMRARVVPCAPSGPSDAVCFRRVIEQLGKRALRRSLSDGEIATYLSLQVFATETNPNVEHDFYSAVALFIRALVQDPEFLYRVEVGTPAQTPGVYALAPNEIAARMSYFLWGSAPDDALLAKAEAGGLLDAADRRREAERMLRDPHAKQQIRRFHAMWLGYRALPHPPELTAAFQSETNALIDRVVFEERQSYYELFRADQTYLTDALADHYGLPRPMGGRGWVKYPESSRRAGILSHGSVLAAFSKFTDTSPTQRGILIKNRLLCQTIANPPPTVQVDKPPAEGTSPCKKDRYLEHAANPFCGSCHGQMDPIGFGLENFDIAGRWRDHDDGLPQCRIEGKGALPGFGDFSGPAELAKKLIDNDLLDRCLVQQLYTFAIGRQVDSTERAMIDDLTKAFRAGDRVLDQMLLGYVASDAFALRKEGI